MVPGFAASADPSKLHIKWYLNDLRLIPKPSSASPSFCVPRCSSVSPWCQLSTAPYQCRQSPRLLSIWTGWSNAIWWQLRRWPELRWIYPAANPLQDWGKWRYLTVTEPPYRPREMGWRGVNLHQSGYRRGFRPTCSFVGSPWPRARASGEGHPEPCRKY